MSEEIKELKEVAQEVTRLIAKRSYTSFGVGEYYIVVEINQELEDLLDKLDELSRVIE